MKRKSADDAENGIDVSGRDLSSFGSQENSSSRTISNFFHQHIVKEEGTQNLGITLLNISRCRLGPNGATNLLSHLSNHSYIKIYQLNLQRNAIGSTGGRAIGSFLHQNQTCTRVDISLNDIKAGGGPLAIELISNALVANERLTALLMNKCALGPDGGAHLAHALKVNSSLNELQLEGNMIGPVGAETLFDALQSNRTLEVLGLKMNRIGGGGANVNGAEKADVRSLAYALGNNNGHQCCQLHTLDLSYNDLRCLGCTILAESLGQSQCALRELTLEKNDIGGEGAVALAHALGSGGSKLQSLVLKGNAIGDVGAMALGEMLQHNDSLRILDISSCSIGNEGGAAIGSGLSMNATLQTLNLDKNSLGSGSNHVLFSEGVSTNKALKTLHLSGNGISDEESLDSSTWGEAVANALSSNTSLQYLDLSNNALSEGSIIDAVAAHTSITTANLSDNDFQSISIETQLKLAGRMTTLDMDLSLNALSSPPLGRLADSTNLRNYLTLLASEKTAVTRIRLMVCGHGGVGKSTFARAITSENDPSGFQASLSPVVEWGTDRLMDWASRLGTLWAEDAARLIFDEGITGKDLTNYVDTDSGGNSSPSELLNSCSSTYQSIDTASFAKAISALCAKGYLSTVGVVKVQGQVPIGDNRTVSLVDFAGQSEFLVSHQLLLSSLHTLCLIIQPAPSFESRDHLHYGSWKYWRQFLSSLGDRRRGSLLLAVSQLDKVLAGEVNNCDCEDLISNEFKKIKERSSGAISCTEALRLDYRPGSIADTIYRAKQALSKSTNEVAHSWWVPNSYETLSKIAQNVAKTKSANHELPILTRDELVHEINNFCERVPQSSALLGKLTTDPRLLQKAIEYMEAVGDVMQAGDQLLIDPIGWFSTFLAHFVKDDLAVSTIQIDNSALKKQRGTIHLADVIEALEHEYVSPHEHIAQIMELLCGLELCVPLDETSFLFPCLLPHLSPCIELLDEGFLNISDVSAVRGHRFRESSGFIPPGLFLGLVARLFQRLAPGTMEPTRMWKDCAVLFLNNKSTRVLLRCDLDESIIDVVGMAPSSEQIFVGAAKGQASIVIWIVHLIKMFLRNYSQLKFDEAWLCTNPECHASRDGRYSYHGSEFPLLSRATSKKSKAHDCDAEGCQRFLGVGHSLDMMQLSCHEPCTTCGKSQVFRLRDVIDD
mmetsp:Transcript_35665/g.72943  ORF Transcript_35665/g.72943 Transcript_35665/m.72943 type:complete len:1176 (+) Transcript_35665:88-3615(+)